ncbi:membrane protein involved in D-alanine export [Peptostreptococcus russellii]|uniref:Teichoic acid D-alanyltransferase n=1 Tax=Peptostreptococcus russellii TaxID=215200 RepID=A0A1H8GC80_9FIRM|nr:D-alanyl-lipoteichoic acid biosynthesis protein DltB [Peptostreptococcus russellii]SEN41439.1 membrane protein involved in D-alanine export [Peptostreptococcus russellii]
MTFSQYDGYLYMYILLLTMIPAVVLGLMEKKLKYYGMLATALMIYLIIGLDVQFRYLAIFMIWEMAVIFIYKNIRTKKKSKWVFRGFLFATMLPLIINKISPITSFGVVGFIGISYLSFRTIQIVIELYDGAITELSFIDTLYFVLFFPTLSSGPIDRSRRFEEEINKKIAKEEYINDYLIPGIKKIFQGLMYKFAIATLIHFYWVSRINPNPGIVPIISYMYAYTLYLFFDFAGYSLLAVGTSYIFGVHAPDNFNKPFLSKDMKEFWTRWHISLSRWFGDYIFSRYVLNAMRKKKFKKRATASHVAQMITMTTMGFWHGLTWYYIVYGLYQGVALVLTDEFTKKSKIYKKYKKKKWFQRLQIFVTFHIICFGMLIFSGFLNHYIKL